MDNRGWRAIALIMWALIALSFVIIFVGTFYVPTLVPGLKASGAKELPVAWQLIVDMADFSNHRWHLVYPIPILLAVYASRRGFER
jgi:hypothetical protein